ncbi:sensor histidine kinase [Cohnella luojiensis]|uniref:Circadian input-output histidine kinase CikA n=1 Tax=Cohnella luojiensis TaxID=652876 RepID=A0A4Y8LS58_9BACL|nr:HAMP domain-containing sensor histidine kinase [Cohnella luojiensis]TFE23683.1 sensor histidine kinase [Cohnella luojiensis]
MGIIKAFLVNIGILITFAYLINTAYNLIFPNLSKSAKYGLSVIIFILAGWLTMFFSFNVGDTSKFDLRVVPLIFGLMVYSHPLTLFLIGLSIGLLRLTFGLEPAAWIGLLNLTLLGALAALICVWFKKRMEFNYLTKAVIAVLGINFFNMVNIAVFGIIPMHQYLSEIAPVTFPTGVILSFFFLFMIRDFQQNQARMEELSLANRLLRLRTQDLNQTKEELEKKAEQLEAASSYKSEFLANMSHELKTPLNSIMLLSEMQMEQDTEDEDRVRYAKMIHQSGGELLGLVNDILDLSKVEAGKLDVSLQPIDLNDVLRLMEEQFQPLADSRNLEFKTTLSEVSTGWIKTDPMRLNQILRNLLGNAFKFTEKGRVEFEISTEIAPGGMEEVIFQVRDTGVGIELDKQEAIFEVFKQEDGSISRKYGGSGLGLAISRKLAELLGGRLELKSEKGEGSCFKLRLPVHVPGK